MVLLKAKLMKLKFLQHFKVTGEPIGIIETMTLSMIAAVVAFFFSCEYLSVMLSCWRHFCIYQKKYILDTNRLPKIGRTEIFHALTYTHRRNRILGDDRSQFIFNSSRETKARFQCCSEWRQDVCVTLLSWFSCCVARLRRAHSNSVEKGKKVDRGGLIPS